MGILAGATLAGVLVIFIALELALALLLRSGADLGSDVWKRARREYYMRYERHIVQYLPECAEYDADLAYRLKPGRCRFHNREFDHEMVVNSAGMRDSEDALAAPRIVVTGDSFAMGWGVAQAETVAAVLGELRGEKTLNAAEPSYGTAREMLLLREVDLSAAHTLVIQYCENDFIENARFVKARGSLATMSSGEYEATVAEHLAATRYWPGKHVRHVLPLLVWAGRGGDGPPDYVRDCKVEALVFSNLLRRFELRAQPLRVIVFEAFYTPEQHSCFGAELARLAGDRAMLPAWAAELHVADPVPLLDAADYYPLDEHLNASGYRKIAQTIAMLIPSRGGPR